VLGERIRSLLLDGELPPTPMASLLLFEAARAQLVSTVIQPALGAGTIVLCDRFTDSTLAYQGYGEGLPLATIDELNALATGGLIPRLTILFDIDPIIGLQRRGTAGAVNAMDARDLEFHRRVRQGFLVLASQFPDRWLMLDATRPLDDLRRQIARRLEDAGLLA